MGDEADAMWDAELIEEGREFAERSFSDQVRGRLRKSARSHIFRKGAPTRRGVVAPSQQCGGSDA